MRRSVLAVALSAALAFALGSACRKDPQPVPTSSTSSPSASATTAPTTPSSAGKAPVHEGSAVARSLDASELYVADEDSHVLHRVRLPLDVHDPPTSVSVPGAPAAVLALRGKVLVTIRTGLLLLMRPDEKLGLVETARVRLPADAWGLAVTPDEKTALVTSAWTHQVSAVDLEQAKVRWSVDVGREPRGVVVMPDGRSAWVTHLVHASLTRIDDLAAERPTTRVVPFPAAPFSTIAQRADAATLGYAAVLSPDSSRLFVPRQALGATGKRAWNGQATVDVLLTADETPLARPAARMYMMQPKAFLARFTDFGMPVDLTLTGPGPTRGWPPFVQPRAVVYRSATHTLLVASEGTNALVELDALSIDPSVNPLRTYGVGYVQRPADDEGDHVGETRCGAPSGVALSEDQRTAFVFCRTTRHLAAVRLDPYDPGHRFQGSPIPTIELGKDPLSEKAALGRRLFFNASDEKISGAYACAGCHPEGRDDGHVWHEEEELEKQVSSSGDREAMTGTNLHAFEMEIRMFPDKGKIATEVVRGAPRQTPMLAGRVRATGPYGWKGRSPNLRHRVISGFRIHRWEQDGFWEYGATAIVRAEAIAAFLREGLATPPVEQRELGAEEERGKKIFMDPSVGCASCHPPKSEYTNRAVVGLGPWRVDEARFEKEKEHDRFKTPSLLFVGGTPPYFHDGSAPTLEAMIEHNGNRMGDTRRLSPEDRRALVAFLRTL